MLFGMVGASDGHGLCVALCGYVVFFFFKQKTAYEMRISDWSSDVCSSDLEAVLETAACLWEAVLTLRDHPATDPDAIALALAIRETCNAVGTADLRDRTSVV